VGEVLCSQVHKVLMGLGLCPVFCEKRGFLVGFMTNWRPVDEPKEGKKAFQNLELWRGKQVFPSGCGGEREHGL